MLEHASEPSDWTLGDIKAHGMALEGVCVTPECNEFASFSLDGLITRFGSDWRVPKILPARCSRCGAWYHFQLAILHDDEPKT